MCILNIPRDKMFDFVTFVSVFVTFIYKNLKKDLD